MSHPDPQGGMREEPARALGVEGSGQELADSVYATLRDLAQQQMRKERRDHTLTPTALVHEAYLKLSGHDSRPIPSAAFYGAAAQAMRRILIDHARRHQAAKRDGGLRRNVELQDIVDLSSSGDPDMILALDEAVRLLEQQDAHAACIVNLRFYGGLSGEQAAEVLEISPRQVDREWAFARAFLLRALTGPRP